MGTLARWEADLVDLRQEWQRYSGLVAGSKGGRRLGLSKKLAGLTQRGVSHLAAVEALRAEVAAFKAVAPF